MSGPRFTDPKTNFRKTTPKYDPDKQQRAPKPRGLKAKITAQDVKTLGVFSVENGYKVWRYTLTFGSTTGKTYVVRTKMTQEEIEEHTVRMWRKATGRDPESAYRALFEGTDICMSQKERDEREVEKRMLLG